MVTTTKKIIDILKEGVPSRSMKRYRVTVMDQSTGRLCYIKYVDDIKPLKDLLGKMGW